MIDMIMIFAGVIVASGLLAWILAWTLMDLIPAFINPNDQPQGSIAWKISYWTHEYFLGGYKYGSIYDTDEEIERELEHVCNRMRRIKPIPQGYTPS